MNPSTISALVVDVLGTLVDEPAGLSTGIRALAPSRDDHGVSQLLELWHGTIKREQQRIVSGQRPFAASHVLDHEAARLGATTVGVGDPAAIARLATAAKRLPPWSDTIASISHLGERFPLIGLSNASRSDLLRFNFHADLRWHQALSAEDARSYKPAPSVYELAVSASGAPPQRLLMVAAHAWDLRGAQQLGMRTAYVARPVGDGPSSSDRFDIYADDLADLAEQLSLPR